MAIVLSFRKNLLARNLLLDEYFLEHDHVDIIALNYDAHGTALCRCDGRLAVLSARRIERIVLGAPKADVEHYLQGIFDPACPSEDVQRIGDHLEFRLPVLAAMKKYDLLNLAKETLRAVHALPGDMVHYFEEQGELPCKNPAGPRPKDSTPFRGNESSRIFHRTSCNSCNEKGCAAAFASREDALKAGFKPCGLCKP